TSRDVNELHDQLTRRLGDSSLPTLPHVAVRIIEMMSNPTAAMNDFADVIKTDQSLSARLLRMSNSAQFAQRKEVTTIERASVLIGLDRLKATALGFHLSKAATIGGSESRQKYVWTQSLYRACLAFRLTEKIDRSAAGEAFVAGLLLDSGIPILPVLAGREAEEIVDRHADPSSQYAEEFNTLEFTHVDVVAAMCKMWALPEVLAVPISRHHRKPKSDWKDSREGILHAVCFFVGGLILNKEAASIYTPPLRSMSLSYFDLKGDELLEVLCKARDDFNGTKEMFSEVTDRTMSVEQILESANAQLGFEDEVKETSEDDIRSIRVGDITLEVLPIRDDLVTIFLSDESGERISSEQIDPKLVSVSDFRERFLLTDATDEQIEQTITEVRSAAA
ncbi:HDOD domain-containing protein, partial [Planctomycetaceae bacterium AH-315-I19]|nr:HDOD domain-containing protein [Planctomycetaceae bacterium AH-315-I19]